MKGGTGYCASGALVRSAVQSQPRVMSQAVLRRPFWASPLSFRRGTVAGTRSMCPSKKIAWAKNSSGCFARFASVGSRRLCQQASYWSSAFQTDFWGLRQQLPQ